MELQTDLFHAIRGRPEWGRAREATLRGIVLSLGAAILVSGCTPAAYTPTQPPATHPASPAAPEASPPPPSQALRDNSILLAPAEDAPAPEAHAGHGAVQRGH